MKAVSIYAITRKQNTEYLQKLEQQLSGRQHPQKIKEWELESMKALVMNLEARTEKVYSLRLFYSFQIPRLGKEFDLLQIKEDQIVNIELKSGAVSEEAIRKQLIQNQYYLSALRRPIYSYTYISSQRRLVRLTRHKNIVRADWEELCEILQRDGADYEGDIEDLFRAERYLISPLTQPNRFLRKEYFLTSQQREIERQIMKKLRAKREGFFCFTGLPGTGKTLLLYDLAMKLSDRQKVCVIHCGESGAGRELLDRRLQRIDLLSDEQICSDQPEEAKEKLGEYRGILVDEAHLLSVELLRILLELSKEQPVIFSSDSEDCISREEMDRSAIQMVEERKDIMVFHLTNRICTNSELSVFIRNMMHYPQKLFQRRYLHVAVVYANDEEETLNLLNDFIRHGYSYLQTNAKSEKLPTLKREVQSLVVRLDQRFYYDADGYLRSASDNEREASEVRWLYHQMNLVKEDLVLVVKENEAVYERLLRLL